MSAMFGKYKMYIGKEPKVTDVDYMTRIKSLESECMMMIKYISNLKSKDKDLDELDNGLLDAFSELSINIEKLEKSRKSGKDDTEMVLKTYKNALKTHNRLSKLTLPATPVSIKYTEFTHGALLETNKTVNLLIFLTIFFFLAFLVINVFVDDSGPYDKYYNTMIIFSASGLGSGFYTLITVRKYLIDRTYSPRYNPTYIIRFIIGITAGTILALMIEPDSITFANDQKIGIGIIAIVGGFSADVVAIILKRIADVLKITLTGTNDDNNQTDTEKRKSS